MLLDQHVKNVIFLKKALIALSVIFSLLVLTAWWQDYQASRQGDDGYLAADLKRFSELGVRTSYVSDYEFGAQAIFQIDSISAIQDLFFGQSRDNLVRELFHPEAFTDVAKRRYQATPEELELAYQTSYYTGNLPILPDQYLHTLLQDPALLPVGQLLEQTLADVRAGVVKLQDYFDIAPPYYYDAAIEARQYYVAPSFPSLTAAEAVTVWLVLAELDPALARHFERQMQQYLQAQLRSGAHFAADIEYAAALASAFWSAAKVDAAYQVPLAAAKRVWQPLAVTAKSEARPVSLPFVTPTFNYESKFAVSFVGAETGQPLGSSEELTGTITLSLDDTRLSERSLRAYDYDLATDTLLPQATSRDSRTQRYGTVAQSNNRFVFLETPAYATVDTTANTLMAQFDTELFAHTMKVGSGRITNLQLSRDGGTVLYTLPDSREGRWRGVKDVTGVNEWVQLEALAIVFGPHDETVIYLTEAGLGVRSFSDSTDRVLSLLPERQGETYLVTNQDRTKLALAYTTLEPNSAELVSRVELFAMHSPEAGEVELSYLGEWRLRDAALGGVALSPSGGYLTVAVAETPAQHRARLLIFNINSGIIKKELNLQPFLPLSTQVTQWSNF